MIKTNLENIVKELELALKESSELIYTNDFSASQLVTKRKNEMLQRESKQLEKRHKKLYNLLIETEKLLKKE